MEDQLMWFKRKSKSKKRKCKSKTMFADVSPSQELPLRIADVLKTACPAFLQTKRYDGYGSVWHDCYCGEQPVEGHLMPHSPNYRHCTCVWQKCKTCHRQTFDELDFVPQEVSLYMNPNAYVSSPNHNIIVHGSITPPTSIILSPERKMTFTYKVYIDEKLKK